MFHKQVEFSDHSGPVYCLSKHVNSVFSSGADKFVVRWDLSQLKQDDFVVKLENSAYSILHLLNLPYLIIGCSNGDLHVVNTDSKEEIKFIQQHKTAIFSIYEVPEKKLIITGDAEGNLCVWKSESFQLLLQIPLNSGKIRAIYHSGNEVIIGSKDGKLRFYDLEFFNQIDEIAINKDGIQSIIQSYNYVLIGAYDGFLYVLDSKEKNLISKIPAHKGPIYSLLIFNENFFVSASRDKSIKIWDRKTFKVLDKKEFKTGGHRNSVNQVLPIDENTFVSCSDDSRIIIWTNK